MLSIQPTTPGLPASAAKETAPLRCAAGIAILPRVGSTLTWAHRWDHVLARCAVNRTGHRVEPGLYALHEPDASSPVFVTANYSLSFDALRSALDGIDGYILVLDTQGINVWCAAGKGTFGTQELVTRIEATALKQVVDHRRLILPQLGAPGVAAHEVKRRSGFTVEYGPVRAADLPAYLVDHLATPEMRQVTFHLRDRLLLIPVEVVHVLLPMVLFSVVLFLLGGWLPAAAAASAILAGVVLFPILLPWLPAHDFSGKGFILGAMVALPFALAAVLLPGLPAGMVGNTGVPWGRLALGGLGYVLAMPPVTAFLALNFTGSTPSTSRSGVRREILAYIPIMAWMFGAGVVLIAALAVIRVLGG